MANASCTDCAEVVNGDAALDDCGDCNGGNAADLGCGCDLPAALDYCADTDGDTFGAGDTTSYCLAVLPTDGSFVEDCSDPEPDCVNTADETTGAAVLMIDECGDCSSATDYVYADLGCGCDLPAALDYCADTDGDTLGAGETTSYCLADLPTDGSFVLDCSDAEPDCATNDTDECGDCGGNGPNEGFDCTGNLLSIEELIPTKFDLGQNYPNPFNPATKITFALPTASHIRLKVFDMVGQEVAQVASGFYTAGLHTISFDGADLPSGIYFYTLSDDGETVIKKMILMK